MRAAQLQIAIATLRANGRGPRRGRRLPRQQPPIPLEREYGRRLKAVVGATIDNYAEVSEWVKGQLTRRRDHTDGISDELKALLAAAARKLKPSNLEALAVGFGDRVEDHTRQQLGKQIKAAVGVDVIGNDPKQGDRVKLWAAQNAQLVEKITADHANKIADLSYQALQKGQTIPSFAEAIQAAAGVSERRAVFIARDQVGSLYGQANSERQKDIGVDKFIWRTSHDERVRPEHIALDGKTFSYDDLPDEGIPGTPILCRCYAEPDFTAILG